MTRLATRLFAAALLAAAAVPSLAVAQEDFDSSSLQVRINLADVRTPGDEAAVRPQMVAAADAWCRAHPVSNSVADCRREVADRLMDNLDHKVRLAMSRQAPTTLARR